MDVFSAVVEGSRPHLREAALHASDALGLAELLSAGSRSLMEIVRALRLPGSHRLHALLDVLALEGAVDVSAAPDGAPRFSARAPLLAPRGNSLPKAGWGRLAEVIRTGVPLDEEGVRGARATGSDALARFHAHLCSAGAEAARELIGPLARAEGGLLLDWGSGAGAYSRAWLEADSAASACLVDRPDVLALARDALGPLSSRAELRAADLLHSDDPAGADAVRARPRVVLLANLLHLFGPDDAKAIVRRAAGALAPGGRVVIKDLLLEPDRRGPASGVLFSLNMALFTERGRVHPRDALERFLLEAGLREVEARSLRAAPDAIVLEGRARSVGSQSMEPQASREPGP